MNKEDVERKKVRILELKVLHNEGLTNREIGKVMGINKTTINRYTKEIGLIPNGKFLPINLVDDLHAKCNKCNEIKSIDAFQIQRKGTPGENRMAYCRTCRKKQLNKAINKDIDKYIKNLFNKIKRDRLSKNIIFTITFEDFLNEYKKSNNKCFYTDKEFTLLSYGLNRRGKCERMSVDRIVPELGYIKENIVFCLTHVNSVKNDCTLVEIKEWMPGFYQRIFNKIEKVEIFKPYLI